MSSSSNVFPERRHLSNVSFSPLSSEVLYVRIRRMSNEENNPSIASAFRQISTRPAVDSNKSGNHSKTTMSDSRETSSISSQTLQKEKKASQGEAQSDPDSTPCLKHAAENISRKACDIPSEKINLCNNCSKSMLSYIFLVQDFLDSLAKEIIGSGTPSCLQCARQEVRDSISKSDFTDKQNVETAFQKHSDRKSNVDSTSRKHSDHKSSGSRQKDVSHERRSGVGMFKGKSHSEEPHKKEHRQEIMNITHQSDVNQPTQHQTDFAYHVTPPNVDHTGMQNIPEESDKRYAVFDQSSSENKTHPMFETSDNRNQQWYSEDKQYNNQQWTPGSNQNINQPVADSQTGWSSPNEGSSGNYSSTLQSSGENYVQHTNPYQQTNERHSDIPEFRTFKERVQPNYQFPSAVPENSSQSDSNSNVLESSPSLYREDLDGIISTLSTAEREIYDTARNRAGWESLTETHERLVAPSGNLITSEAFVTSCRNNAEAMGCLVLGTSLLLCRTSRTLCVVSEGVSTAFRNAFSAVFQVVQLVRSLDSLGTTKLALLEQPELGVSFEKLNIWRLVQFTKCVYLNPDTLVIQNCDELFCREELSAVPDIGWPDCFNGGVFVYSPSVHTFWQLLEFAEKQGSYDGGDQGLLNSYFNSWSSDISKKLSFIYNLMANVSYTYSPAFRQFGRDVKIVQFHGSFKPWHVKFFTNSGQISPSSPVHPTYVQFVHIWINIFRITVLRLLSQEIQTYAASQEVINAVEMLRFFPLPTESESEFFLTPPSVRLRLAERKLNKPQSLSVSEARRRKSAEVFRHTITEDDIQETKTPEKEKIKFDIATEPKEVVATEPKEPVSDAPITKENIQESVSETDEVFKESKAIAKENKPKDKNALPGSEIGDYQGMKAWEQGRMDYEGNASSDNIIKRLEFLMNPKPK